MYVETHINKVASVFNKSVPTVCPLSKFYIHLQKLKIVFEQQMLSLEKNNNNNKHPETILQIKKKKKCTEAKPRTIRLIYA